MMFGRDDWTLFRNLSTLGQKAGVPRDRLAGLAIKELADNALDAGADCTVGEVGRGYYVEDDGPGIDGTNEAIAQLFSIRRPLTSSKLFRLPTRGALGNGLRVVAGTVLASGGKLRVRTQGRVLKLTPQDDGSTSYEVVSTEETTGTRIEIEFGGDLRHQEGVLSMAKLAIGMRGESRYEGRTSPHWYDSDSFFELLQGAGETPLKTLLTSFDGYLRSSKLRNGWNPACSSHDRAEAESLLLELRNCSKPPKATKLGQVGNVFDYDGYSKKMGEFTIPAARGILEAKVPAVIECWATKLEKEADPDAVIFINRTPITAKINCGKDAAKMWISGCGLSHYFKTGRMPMQIYICVTAPYMPITTDGKEPNLRPLLAPIAEAVTAATRKAKVATASGAAPVSKKQAVFDAMDSAIAQASGDGEHRFSLRQLFYSVRPILQADGVDGDMDYNYFASVVTDYEADQGRDVPGMYRDTRGVLYHPHTGEQIALGTLNVEKYKRPEYRFNKVLYIEKGGFFPLLIDAKWAERHDCALLTSQGFASRAARDVIDLLGDGDGELLFFCIHDADGPGTMIYQALVEGTRARPGRRVKVVNLGLDPWEGHAMGLQAEDVKRAKGRVPVAKYVLRDMPRGGRIDWYDWLQNHRYELNAMSSPKFLKWLDKKMEEYDHLGKVVPPRDVLSMRLFNETEVRVRARILDKLAREAGLDLLVDNEMAAIRQDGDLVERVRSELRILPEDSWEQPILRIADRAAKKG